MVGDQHGFANHRWGTIVMMTVGLRLCLFPVIVKGQKYGARMALHGPKMKALQAEITNAKTKGDMTLVQYRTQELIKYIKANGINPLEALKPLAIQAPMLMGMFFGIRRLADAPLPGFLTEGFGWVTDLTLADPLYILPFATIIFQNLALRVSHAVNLADCRPAWTEEGKEQHRISETPFPFSRYFYSSLLRVSLQ
jgi:YidC/Oxa1 family membrane protein insertase